MKKLRWGVIGAGGIADRRTIPGMMLAKNAELIAVMDINAEQVEKIRQKYGAKRGYTKEEDLLADPEVDAVYIATPIVLHAKQAKLAADYGKDILIEKPLAMTSDEGQEVIEYCESKGVKIAAGFMMRFGSHVMSMKKAIAEGKIGTVVSGYSQFTLWLPYEPGNWRQCKAKAGGGQRRLDPGVARADHGDIKLSGEEFGHKVEILSSVCMGIVRAAHQPVHGHIVEVRDVEQRVIPGLGAQLQVLIAPG